MHTLYVIWTLEETGTPDWMKWFETSSVQFRMYCEYLLTYLLTSWCRIIFEQLIVTQLVTECLFLWRPKVHCRLHKSPPSDPIRNQLNPLHAIHPYLPKVHLNVILPPTPTFSQWSLASQPKLCKHLSPPPCVPHAPPTSTSLL